MDTLNQERGTLANGVHCTARLCAMQQTYIVLTSIMLSVTTTNRIYSPFNIIVLTLFIHDIIYCHHITTCHHHIFKWLLFLVPFTDEGS